MQKFAITIMVCLMFQSGLVYAGAPEKAVEKLLNKETRAEAIKELEKIGSPALPQLRELAKDKKKDSDARVSAIILLGRIKASEASPDLEAILEEDNDKFCREASAISLGNLGDRKAIPKLKQAMKDKSGNVRMRAVWAMAKLGDKSGKQLALETIKEGKDATHKLLASEALGEIGDKDAIPELKENLKSPDVRTRWFSKVAIKKIEMARMTVAEKIKELEKTLNGDDMNNWAAIELAKIGTSEATETLKKTYRDKESPGSASAYKVLIKMAERGEIEKAELER